MKHNSYWELEEEVRDVLIKESSIPGNLDPSNKPKKIINVEIQEDIKLEIQEDLQGVKGEYCEKAFLTQRGLIVHMSRMHKEEVKEKSQEGSQINATYVGSNLQQKML